MLHNIVDGELVLFAGHIPFNSGLLMGPHRILSWLGGARRAS